MRGVSVTERTRPERFTVEMIRANIFDVTVSDGVEEIKRYTRADGEVSEEIEKYSYSLYSGIVRAKDYGEFIAGVVHLLYSIDDEAALINKGIADSDNAEYAAYREFVGEVKTLAREYFEKD